MLGEVARGNDPSAERMKARRTNTLEQFAESYLEYARDRLKPGTWKEYKRLLDQHVLPVLGRKKLPDVGQADVMRLHQRLAVKKPKTVIPANAKKEKGYRKTTGGQFLANRALATIKIVFHHAERLGLIQENPCRHVQAFKEKARARYLTPDELARLADALNVAQAAGTASPWAVGAIKLLMFTGCRRDEILTLQWSFIDAEGRCLRLPESKTGAKVVYLNTPALEVLTDLAKLREAGNPFVIVGHVAGARMVNLTTPWYRILKAAGLEGLRLHDLRHVYAGMGAALGLGLPVVGKLLGHTQAQTTQRYANLAPDPVAAAAERIGEALLDAMDKGRARVVELSAGPGQPGVERAVAKGKV
jgi:integrase